MLPPLSSRQRFGRVHGGCLQSVQPLSGTSWQFSTGVPQGRQPRSATLPPYEALPSPNPPPPPTPRPRQLGVSLGGWYGPSHPSP